MSKRQSRPMYIVRIELHELNTHDHPDYKKLHEVMKEKGFERTLDTSDGVFHLPTAEYIHSDGELDDRDVMELAVAAADFVGREASIIASAVEEGNFNFYNLREVDG